MNLENLKLLDVLARTGSLRKAAEEIGSSQPRLTQQLQKIEHDLGAVLFHRSPNGVTLSEAGRAFLPFARKISGTFSAAQSAISELGYGATRRLRVGISITASMHLMPGNLLAFHRRHPEVVVNVTRTTPKLLLRGLESDQFDLCFGLELPESSLVAREEVFSTRMAGFSSTTMATEKRQRLEQFCRMPLVLPPRWCGTRALLEEALRRSKIQPKVLMEIDDPGTIIAIVKTGVAATILPRVLPGLSKSLVLAEISDFVGEVKGTMLFPRNPKPEAQSFMQVVSERISSQTDWKTI
jgi:LysR family cyn operon transcriptional activator